jgi:hypothetical protein
MIYPSFGGKLSSPMAIKPYKVRPHLPWYLEDDIHDNNAFNAFKTPAGIMVYIANELPESVPDLLAGIIDAGAGWESLMRDVIELAEMGHNNLAEQILEAAESEHIPAWGKSMTEMDFMPESMEGANEVVLKATAAITMMKARERMEGVNVQDREE